MSNLEIYSKEWCPYCAKAKALLAAKGVDYTEIDVTSDLEREREMVERSQRRTVPQIFIDGDSIGGYDDLAHLNATGELDRLLGIAAEESDGVERTAPVSRSPARASPFGLMDMATRWSQVPTWFSSSPRMPTSTGSRRSSASGWPMSPSTAAARS